jgi:hypothetical protein
MAKTNRSEALKGGVNALFGGAPAREPQREAVAPSEEAEDIISTVQDEELKRALRQRQMDGRGRPKKGKPHSSKTDGYGTVCAKANLEKWAKLEYIALKETLQKKEVLELALDMLIDKYESEKGKIVLPASSKKGNVFNK